ncbi:hypothetical protein [Neobacillus mesonae]|uniref:Uncharacterized protein n=1 Tax=Neobacillus mesonae TaxID=1193713 RepID=A0A3Q9QZG4_9BACI|nr:hypothetical protein [Neobacillus mesonae]AZU62437.1 hypothetical protein CHR53_14765 [Neobacillus mesonae]
MGIRRLCECSGTVNTDFFGTFSANICPSCFIVGSTVTLDATRDFGFSFSSNTVNRPDCSVINGQSTLNTTGTGTITIGTETLTGAFTISLVHGPGENDNIFKFTLVDFETMGSIFFFQAESSGLPIFTITGCNSTTFNKGFNSNATNSILTGRFTEIKFFSKGRWYEKKVSR